MAAKVEFRVLGPVGVWIGGAPVAVGGPSPRGLLAVLLLSRGKPVSAARLVDALWGDDPPTTATGRVHAIVSELRRALAGAGLGSGIIRRQSGGYVLGETDAALDLADFSAAAAAGRQAVAEGRHEQAVTLFRNALAAWSGMALEGLDGPLALREAARLEERRLDVIEACAAARLEAPGAPDPGLIDELTALASDHPQREAVVALLMTALHRAGRTPEALAACQANRRWLRDELGLDPSSRLQQLELAILRDDPSITPSAPARASADPRVRPRQLPAPVAGFTGRTRELEALERLLPNAQTTPTGLPLVVLSGAAGVGKTELALQWSRRIAGRYPDGQLFVDLKGHAPGEPADPAQVLGGFLRSLGVSPESVPVDASEAAAMYRSMLSDMQMLVLLDNARSPDQVRPLLPGSPGCLVVVTSRSRLDGLVAGDGAQAVPVGALTSQEATALIGSILGPVRVAAEPEAATRLVERCAHLPLALRIAAANLAAGSGTTIARYVARLEEAGLLSTLTVHGDEQRSVAAALHLSYHGLTAAARRTFRLLGAFGLAGYAEQAVTALAAGDVARELDELVDAHLLQRTPERRYCLHDLLAEYAGSLAAIEEAEGARAAAFKGLCQWYLDIARHARRVLYPTDEAGYGEQAPIPAIFKSHEEALAWFDAERANLVTVVRTAAQYAQHAMACDLATHLVCYYDLRKHWGDWIETHVVAAESARILGNDGIAARIANYTAVAYGQRRQLDLAFEHHRRALELCRRAQDFPMEATALTSLGVTCAVSKRLDEAIEHFKSALALHRRTGNVDGEAIALNNLAEAQIETGSNEEALVCLKEALTIAERLGNQYLMRVILCGLGVVHDALRQYNEAVENFDRAIAVGHQIHDMYGVAETLGCLGDALHHVGNSEAAHDRWDEAAEILDGIDPKRTAKLRQRTTGCCTDKGFTPQER